MSTKYGPTPDGRGITGPVGHIGPTCHPGPRGMPGWLPIDTLPREVKIVEVQDAAGDVYLARVSLTGVTVDADWRVQPMAWRPLV
jgi:hypothetical protein